MPVKMSTNQNVDTHRKSAGPKSKHQEINLTSFHLNQSMKNFFTAKTERRQF